MNERTKDPKKVAAGKRTAAIAAAKRQVASTGEPVQLDAYGIRVEIDGSTVVIETPYEAPPQPGSFDGDEPEGPPDDAPPTMMDEMAKYKEMGLSDAEAWTLLNAKYGGQDTTPAAPVGVEQKMVNQEQQGPDPAMIAAYEERMKTYVAPVLDETFQVTMPVRFADKVRRKAISETIKRGREMDPADCIQYLIRQYFLTDYDTLIAAAGATGPAAAFNPQTGGFTNE
jgi:hypothetical protein